MLGIFSPDPIKFVHPQVIRTRRELFAWINVSAKADPDRRRIRKTLVDLFDEITAACGRRGAWEWKGSRAKLKRHISRERRNEEHVECGADVLYLLHGFADQCFQFDGSCQLHCVPAVTSVMDGTDEAIAYRIKRNSVRVFSEDLFTKCNGVDLSVRLGGLGGVYAWHMARKWVEVA